MPRAVALKLEELSGLAQPVRRAEVSRGIGDQDGAPPPV